MKKRDLKNEHRQIGSAAQLNFNKVRQAAADKSIDKCITLDEQKIAAGTHKWVREGKTVSLKRITE